MSTPSPFTIGNPTVIASDTFAGTDPPVSISTWNSNWTLVTTSAIGVGAAGARITGGGTSYAAALYNASWPNDQFAQFTVNAINSVQMGVILRGTVGASGVSGYVLGVSQSNAVVTLVTNGAATTQLANIANSPALAVGDVFRFTNVGFTLFVERNGVLIWKGTNNGNYASGSAGVAGVTTGGNSVIITNWSAGSVVLPVLTPGFCVTPVGPISITGAVNNTWKTVTVGVDAGGGVGPPPYTNISGLIVMWNSSNSTTLITRSSSAGGFNTQPPVGNAPAATTQGIIHTGVVLTGGPPPTAVTFDFIASNVTGLQLWVVGYYGAEAVFFDPPISITTPTTFPGTINLSAQIPSSAVAIFANLWGDTTRIVPHGDADIVNYHPTGLNSQSVVCGVSGGQIDITAATGTTPVLWLRGYMKYGFTWRTPPVVVTPASTGWVGLAQAGGYVGTPSGYLYEVNGTTNYSLSTQWPQTGNYKPVIACAPASGNTMGAGSAPTATANLAATTGITIAEQGYFVATAAATAPTTTKAYFAVRTTSQS